MMLEMVSTPISGVGRVDKFDLPSDTDWSGIGEVYKKYDAIKKPFPYGKFVFDKTKVDVEMTSISQVIGELLPAILYGKTDDPQKAVMELRDKLKSAGYDKVMAEIQSQLDAYKKLIEG